MQKNISYCNNGSRFLRLAEVKMRVGLSKSTIYDHIERKRFPAPHKLGSNVSVWIEDEITAWMNWHLQPQGSFK